MPIPPPPPRRLSLAFDVALVVTVLVVAGWFGWRSRNVPSPGSIPAVASSEKAEFDKRNIAVLYFENRSSGGQFENVTRGLTEALIGQLRAVPQLVVASSHVSALFRRHPDAETDSIARQFDVGTLLVGRLSTLGNGVRVDSDVLDALSAQVIANAHAEQRNRDWIALQDSVAEAVTRLLRQRLADSVPRLVSVGRCAYTLDANVLVP